MVWSSSNYNHSEKYSTTESQSNRKAEGRENWAKSGEKVGENKACGRCCLQWNNSKGGSCLTYGHSILGILSYIHSCCKEKLIFNINKWRVQLLRTPNSVLAQMSQSPNLSSSCHMPYQVLATVASVYWRSSHSFPFCGLLAICETKQPYATNETKWNLGSSTENSSRLAGPLCGKWHRGRSLLVGRESQQHWQWGSVVQLDRRPYRSEYGTESGLHSCLPPPPAL